LLLPAGALDELVQKIGISGVVVLSPIERSANLLQSANVVW
jgi:hypothetical protein